MPLAGINIKASDVPPDSWTAWTPTWTGTTNPVIGNGSISGTYYQVGKMVVVRGYLQIGSTTTIGTGSYLMSSPIALSTAPNSQVPHGTAWFRDVSTALDYTYFGLVASATTMQFRGYGQGVSTIWTATTPAAPAVGDWFAWEFTATVA